MRQWDEKFVSCSYFFVTFTKALRQTVRTSSAGSASALFQLLTMTFRFTLSLAALMAGLSSMPNSATAAYASTVNSVSAPVRVNSVGFLPESRKVATIGAACSEFRVLDAATAAVVFTGQASAPLKTAASDTDEMVQLVDFSEVKAPGRYVLEVPGVGRSAEFRIGGDVWTEPYALVTRGMYLWRCGVEASGEWKGRKYHHDACHLQDGLLDYVGGPAGTIRPSVGGWHDAGDYNKYVVNAGVSVGLMFKAWEQFRERIEPVSVALPESGKGMPDLLAELKFEFEWLFTMQADDGRVYHKLSAKTFRYWGPSEKDESPRYYTPWSTTATADFVAMMALGARHFREFDPALAERCLTAARKSWAVLVAHPENVAPDLTDFHTGGYDVPDTTHRLWALAELWETTGEEVFLRDFEKRVSAMATGFTHDGPSWGEVRDLALGTYLLSARSQAHDQKLVKHLTRSLDGMTSRIVEDARVNPHGRPYGAAKASFYWGCNGSVVGQTYLLHVADRLMPEPVYRATALDALGYLFGRNYHGRSYVTGLGANPPEHLHDRRGEPAWPGYLVGGPWPTARDWVDEMPDASRNEIAINWNASLIYALAAFVEPGAGSAQK